MSRHPERIVTSRRPAPVHVIALSGAVVGTILMLAGCSGPDAPMPPTASPSAPSATPAATPSATPTATRTADLGPALDPDGTADDNLPFFASVTAAVWGSPDSASGRAYIDALVAAGFDKAAMQVTRDTSTVGNPAESIQFSVRWGDECLVGQVGPATGVPVAVVVPVLAEGTCLVGETRPIDW